MSKILGLDLGTNSIGLAIRDTDNGKNLEEQLERFAVTRFKSGVGNGQNGEFSYAAERTSHRSPRRLYQARKYRIWATLKILIEYGYCPLSMDDLEKWSKYDKAKGLKRQYPVNAEKFEQWVRLDFDGDGDIKYSSPFQLRAELMEKQFDLSNETDRFKLGRALYHIAQRRGFRSSKGETIKEQEQAEIDANLENEIDLSTELKKSEEKKSGKLVSYMKEHNLPTIGCAFHHLEKSGIRVRNSEYQAVRSQYKDEITAIFSFQNGLNIDSDFYKRIISEKKNEGTIFYKRPLRSQKGLVGKCTLEPKKARCPISHPEFEKFRAWCFINNIQYRKTTDDDWQNLTMEQKQKLYQDKFLRTKSHFKFQEIREWIEKEIKDDTRAYILEYTQKKEMRTINYKDNTSVSGCPITGRLRNLFGENWERWTLQTSHERANHKTGEIHTITYNIHDVWHVCFSFDEPEFVEEFARNELNFDAQQTKQLVSVWGAIAQGYAMLSLKAIRNINRFLLKGLIYTDAVLLAKLPEIFGDKWSENENDVVAQIDDIIAQNREEKQIYNIANTLISNYKSLDFDEELNYNEKFAEHDYQYELQPSDYDDVKKVTIEAIGEKTWANKTEAEQNDILSKVAALYQQFFFSQERDYFHLPKLADALAKYLSKRFAFLSEKSLSKIYHPSMIAYYAPAKEQRIEDGRYIKLLGSPVIGALKNPMAMRVLHTLRRQINYMLKNGFIDEDTRIVVETARELNDANWRWAIETYQEEREKENKEFEKIIKEYDSQRNITHEDLDKVRLLAEQYDIPEQGEIPNDTPKSKKTKTKIEKVNPYKKDIAKYRLWLEQGCRCIYTGKLINITALFDDNQVDFEHTIPRSISFDNSLANLTVCDAHFNRTVKKNQIPTQLQNYDEILGRIQPWIKKVETLNNNIEYWKAQSKRAQDKTRKDDCIRQRHLWELELDYWQKKVNAFTTKEVTSGFRNSQLNDTRIITKYAYHYLKTVFNKVEVQNGRYTADFRKMLGIQSIDEKKNRDKHSHHAIDAAVLTMIPVAAKRDRMLELFYQIEEDEKLHKDVTTKKEKLRKEIAGCQLGKNVSTVTEIIEQNVLVNLVGKDQTLTPAKRKARSRGKEIFVTNSEGKKVNKWITGDCIRGKLHKESFFGAIKQAITETGIKNGKEIISLKRDQNGAILTENNVKYVIRRELKWAKNDKDSGFKNWEELEKVIVNKCLFKLMKEQFPEGTNFKDACEHGIYMIKKKKDRITSQNFKSWEDLENYTADKCLFKMIKAQFAEEISFEDACKKGIHMLEKTNRIRHIRCYTSVKNPLAIKKQTYLSSKEYKQNYYADMGDLYVMCKYENKDKNLADYKIWSLFDICENRKNGLPDIPDKIEGEKQHILSLTYKLKSGDILLIYPNEHTHLHEMDNADLSKHLYVIRGFENPYCIKLVRHINAQADNVLGKGESVKKDKPLPEKIRCSINTLKFMIEGRDFEITPMGEIKFYD